ncbi:MULTISPECIES: ExbD/TolR family protein [Oscillatoriophycideae]|uniref:Biopolymer transporter ExbD n=1 Tax=Aerosakkonema funiforme FACHB-1375 TaxID=2949571 RepID=A0A926VMJ2_9CYAN|nr:MULTISPECIES: biopolymer transporter ExbD [Oscillatoriales]MBD2186439.1 biopolymer transporter ExbD [Aerosakkonema funiforme FACHB-1375]MBD3563264.1 biopolymer transporter ExbD [Planktothrix sp. FACHB-1355]
MRLPDEPDIPPQINIVPMIDVVFAILTFFVMSSLFLTRSEGLSVNLPSAATGKSQPPAQVTVTVDEQGRLALNREPIELEALENAVRQQIKPNQPLLVVLNADKAVNHGQVVQVMDRLRRVEGAKLAIATQKP